MPNYSKTTRALLSFGPFRHRKEQLDEIDQRASEVHKKNINKIVKSRENAVKLKIALKENNITLELAKAIGH